MVYNINSIETQFAGFTFRSRLEARWAAFFTLLGWRWDYEPADFGGWIPDFVIYGKRPVYVEIKPVLSWPQEVADKIDKSSCVDEVLILGQSCPLTATPSYDGEFGWLREDAGGTDMSAPPVFDGSSWWWDTAVLGKWEDGKGAIGFCHCMGSYSDRITGGYDGGCFGNLGQPSNDEIHHLWGAAHRVTRWNKTTR